MLIKAATCIVQNIWNPIIAPIKRGYLCGTWKHYLTWQQGEALIKQVHRKRIQKSMTCNIYGYIIRVMFNRTKFAQNIICLNTKTLSTDLWPEQYVWSCCYNKNTCRRGLHIGMRDNSVNKMMMAGCRKNDIRFGAKPLFEPFLAYC